MSRTTAKPEEAPRLFHAHLSQRGLRLEGMVASEGIDAMLDFFRAQRFDFQGEDWLLFQYGTYDWGDGPYFEIDITRQFAVEIDYDEESGDDDEGEGMWQLSLTFRFTPEPALDALGSDHRWCKSHAPEVVAEFESFIRTSRPYLALANRRAEKVDLDYEDAG